MAVERLGADEGRVTAEFRPPTAVRVGWIEQQASAAGLELPGGEDGQQGILQGHHPAFVVLEGPEAPVVRLLANINAPVHQVDVLPGEAQAFARSNSEKCPAGESDVVRFGQSQEHAAHVFQPLKERRVARIFVAAVQLARRPRQGAYRIYRDVPLLHDVRKERAQYPDEHAHRCWRQASLGLRLGLLGWVPFAVVADRKSTRLNSSHLVISYAVFCL